MIELTIEQAKKHPADFLYLWATNDFLLRLKRTPRLIIDGKRSNQRKLITLSARAYLNKNAQYNDADYKKYTDAIYSAFKNIYGMTPEKALEVLASGGNVAGKNWKKGVYGIGGRQTTFKQDSSITVDPKTGRILKNGSDTFGLYQQRFGEDPVVYGDDGNGNTVALQYFYEEGDNCYSSVRNEDGTYSAYSVEDNTTGALQTATGSSMDASESASMWSSIIMQLGQFLEWLINLFNKSGNESNKKLINSSNTLPSQQKDGFVYQSGFGEAGTIMLVLLAGGILSAKGLFRGNKKKSK